MKVFFDFPTLLKRALLVFFAFCIFTFFFSKTDACFFLTQKILYNHEFLTATQVEEKWGRVPFDATKFRAKKDRKEMAADILKSRVLIGLTYDEVERLLGERGGGYYVSDEVLTYHVFVAQSPKGHVAEAYSLLILRENATDPQSRVNRVYVWKDR